MMMLNRKILLLAVCSWIVTTGSKMKLKTYKEFRLDNKELDKAISDEEQEHMIFKKHFKLQQLRRSNYLIKNGIEKAEDNLGVCN